MRNKLLLISLLFSANAMAQVSVGIEQIYYFEKTGDFSMGPIVQIQNRNHWYAEMRYNYEDKETGSLYLGRVFSKEGALSYSIVPIFGGVVGRFKGGSAGLNMEIDYKGFLFATQSQYTFSSVGETQNFYYSWSELAYQPCKWAYGGLSLQETYLPQTQENEANPGFVLGIMYKNWTVPVYAFRTSSGQIDSFVCSIVWEWQR